MTDIQLPGVWGQVVHVSDDDSRTLCGLDSSRATDVDMGVSVHKRCRQCIDADPFWSVVFGGNHAGEGPIA